MKRLLFCISIIALLLILNGCAPKIHVASSTGATGKIEQLIENGIDINTQNLGGETPLMVAAMQGQLEVARVLIDKGADLDIQAMLGNTALTLAMLSKQYPVAHLLIDKGANPNLNNIFGQTALNVAVLYGQTDIVRKLIDKGANIDKNAFQKAKNPSRSHIRRMLLRKNTDLGNKNQGNISSFFLAAAKGQTDVVRKLIDEGVNINLQNHVGNTALSLAAYKGHTDIVRILIDKNANLDLQNEYGNTALLWAISYGQTDIARTLIKKGANLTLRDKSGNTALSLALLKKNQVIISLIESSRPTHSNKRQIGNGTILKKEQDKSMQQFVPIPPPEVSTTKLPDAPSLFKEGLEYSTNTTGELDYYKAAKLFDMAAVLGHADAMIKLGELYAHGLGVPKDYKLATNWLRRAIKDDPTANVGESIEWCRLAAMQGHVDGQYVLAVLYQNGLGTEQNGHEAIRWYGQAAKQGDTEAQQFIQNLTSNLIPSELEMIKGILD